jgi:hypothetical protein
MTSQLSRTSSHRLLHAGIVVVDSTADQLRVLWEVV